MTLHTIQKSAVRLLLIAGLTLATSGCYRMTMYAPTEPPSNPPEEPFLLDTGDNGKWSHNALYGLIPIGAVNVDEICPEGIYSVHTRMSFLNALVNIATFSMYNPQTVYVTCTDGSEHAMEMTDEGDAAESEGTEATDSASEEAEAAGDDAAQDTGSEAPAESDAAGDESGDGM